MVSSNGTAAITVEGFVASANSKGIRLAGEQDWRNWSKFTNEQVTPAIGAHVVLTLDKAGFIRRLEEQRTTSAPEPQPEPPDQAPAVYLNADAKDIRITRLAVLNTATAILSAGSLPIADPAEVVKLAVRLEQWVLRK